MGGMSWKDIDVRIYIYEKKLASVGKPSYIYVMYNV